MKARTSSEDFLFGRPATVSADDEDAGDKLKGLIQQELERYEAAARPHPDVKTSDWWRRHALEYPNVARVDARHPRLDRCR